MFNWVQGAIASVAGTAEPVYGPDAIHPVTKQAKETPYTLLSKQDQKWIVPETSFVETQTFYIHSDAGPFAFVQLIYSNVAITATCQFNTQIYYHDEGKTPPLWCSDAVADWHLDEEKYNFLGDKCSIELSEDGDMYTIKSTTNLHAVVNLTVKRTAPGFVVGTNGTTHYGHDEKAPWGSMRHSFWPTCEVKGSVMTQGGEVKLDGRGQYIHALQGMKPHHCAARWNFVNFQSPSYSAVMMEFTTPPSYDSTVVTVGGVVSGKEIVFAGADTTVEHVEVKGDTEVDWPEPSAIKYVWRGKTADGKDAVATLEGPLGERLDRVDVMGELPGFVKQLASAAVGTRPYIYQYGTKMTLKLKVGEEEKEEEGQIFAEATFIS